jgi:type II secretion system protein D
MLILHLHSARVRASFFFALCVAISTSLHQVALAQELPKPTDQPQNSLAGQVELARLVDLAAERMKLAVEYDSSVLKGTVTLRLTAALSDSELWDLTNRVLAARGLTTVRTRPEGPLSVVRLTDASGLAAVRTGEELAVPAGFTTAVVRVRNRSAKEFAEAIKGVLSKTGGSASPLGDSGLLMVSDLSPRVEQVLSILELLDVTSGQVVVQEVPAKNLPATQLATLAIQVLAKRSVLTGDSGMGEPNRPGTFRGDVLASPAGGAVLVVAPVDQLPAWRELLAQLDQRESVETFTYIPRSFPPGEVGKLIEQIAREPTAVAGQAGTPDERWRLVIDDLTSTLIVTATPSQHQKIRSLLERLDGVPPEARRPVRSFVIRNRPVTQVVEVLNRLMEAGVLDSAGDAISSEARPSLQDPLGRTPPSTPAASPTGADASAAGGGGTQPITAPSTSTSPNRGSQPSEPQRSPTVTPGRGSMGQAGRALVLTADEGTNTLIAIGEPRLLAQLETLLAKLDVRQAQVMLEVMLASLTEAQTLDLGVELERIWTSNDDTKIRLASLFGLSNSSAGGRAIGDAAGFTGAILNPGEFSLIVRALQTLNHGRSLSVPQVLVNNNQQATITSVLQQPVLTTNASTTVATTSFGGTQDAGTTLTIRPQIAEGDHLVLDYSVTLSSFVGSSSNASLPPPRLQNNVRSTLTIPDGYTVVVGGLHLESDSKSTTKVPLLGEIPILGELFKTRNNTNSSTKFYVFIRAGVMRSRSFEDLKYISDLASAQIGVDDGFPEVEPQVIR